MSTTLWTPFDLGGVHLRNRVVMAPLVKFTIDGEDGMVKPALVEHYRLRAASGTGLIIVEATAPCREGKLHVNNLGLWDDSMIPGFRAIADAIHGEGAAAILQLCYAGVSSKDPGAAHVGPSRVYHQLGSRLFLARELDIPEMAKIRKDFKDAAVRAVRAGFDGIELHAAHSKLFAYYHDRVLNHRTDEYGGDAENRTRFLRETVAEIREAVPEGFLIGARLGVAAPDYETGRENILALDRHHTLDYMHLSTNIIMPEPGVEVPEHFPGDEVVWLGSLLAKEVHVPVMLSHGIAVPSQAEALIAGGYGDLVSIGRGMLADYDWTGKAMRGEPVDECRHCAVCMWRTDEYKCPAVKARGGEKA